MNNRLTDLSSMPTAGIDRRTISTCPHDRSNWFPANGFSQGGMAYRLGSIALTLLLILAAVARPVNGTDWVQLTPKNWDEYVPAGKEVDAIYGDYALRNDKIVAIIAKPDPSRNANLTIRDVGGFVLDLTSRAEPNDQLSCYVPLGGAFHFHNEQKISVLVDGNPAERQEASGKSISVRIESSTGRDGAKATVEYTLNENSDFLQIQHAITTADGEPGGGTFTDSIRADRTFQFSTHADNRLFCANDDWFRQCYGVCYPVGTLKQGQGRVSIDFQPGESTTDTDPTTRFLFPASSLLGAKGLAWSKLGTKVVPVQVVVKEPRGPIEQALITLEQDGKKVGTARTDAQGQVRFHLASGTYDARTETPGQAPREAQLEVNLGSADEEAELDGKSSRLQATLTSDLEVEVTYDQNRPLVEANIVDEQGRGIPCKVAFIGTEGTPNPDLGPDSAANPVQNLHYSHTGKFQQPLPAGKYEVIISRGPEYDAEYLTIETRKNEITRIAATLKRVVQTKGWISTEYHSHSSPSGDNTSDQRGRVLNLVGENIEFAPCTEHQRVDSYLPHIRALGVEPWISTCSGMELTGNPLPLNHQNAFPLVHRPRTQDGGGPRIDPDPVVQIERLAYWDNRSEKVVQSNHPNLVQMAGDADLDGQVDGGFKKMFDYMDVVEVHPPQTIFEPQDSLPVKGQRGNVIFNWLQLLNQGYRIVGVVNTDAHYNFHGSGWLRNYVRCSTDDAGRIDTMEIVRNTKKGHLVMTTGPFMEVTLSPVNSGETFIPGNDVAIPSGKFNVTVKIQCANWLDVNRVQLFVNGKPEPKFNFRRRTHQDLFANGVVKFEQTIPVEIKSDAHIIVATIGEGLTLGRVMGEQFGQSPPCAVSNPIFVEVDGDGFEASGDKLGAPLLLEK